MKKDYLLLIYRLSVKRTQFRTVPQAEPGEKAKNSFRSLGKHKNPKKNAGNIDIGGITVIITVATK